MTVHDTKEVTLWDLSSQYYLSEKDVGMHCLLLARASHLSSVYASFASHSRDKAVMFLLPICWRREKAATSKAHHNCTVKEEGASLHVFRCPVLMLGTCVVVYGQERIALLRVRLNCRSSTARSVPSLLCRLLTTHYVYCYAIWLRTHRLHRPIATLYLWSPPE